MYLARSCILQTRCPEHPYKIYMKLAAAAEIEQAITASLPASPNCLDSYSKAQAKDEVCSKLIDYCKSGWPTKQNLKGLLEVMVN